MCRDPMPNKARKWAARPWHGCRSWPKRSGQGLTPCASGLSPATRHQLEGAGGQGHQGAILGTNFAAREADGAAAPLAVGGGDEITAAGRDVVQREIDGGHAEGRGVMRAAGRGRSEERRVGKECRSRWSPYH